MLGAHVTVITCMSRDKPRWSGPGHVLVNDRASAREGWERKGGVFVHHRSAERSIAALRRLGFADERRPSAPPPRRSDDPGGASCSGS